MSTPDPGQDRTPHRSFRLTRPGATSPLQVRAAIVLPDREARSLLSAAGQQDVSRGGRFSAGPSGVQWWTGPWDGLLGTRGTAEHLGSVDWSWDTPSRHYVTIYRILVTVRGDRDGLQAPAVLAAVLALTGVSVPAEALASTSSAPSDPFHRRLGAQLQH